VLIRCLVGQGHWAEDIPPVPAGFAVTVSFGCETTADEHRDALELLGYRIVDAPRPADPTLVGAADFLVTQDLMAAYPTYWRSLAQHGCRAYHLSLGPAAAAVADVVAAHRRLSPA